MALEAMRHLPPSSVLQAILLFPTVNHIGKTPNGVNLQPIFQYFKGAAWMLTHAIAALPASVQRAMLRPFMAQADEASFEASLSLIHPDVAYNALWLALHEMAEIRNLDHEHAAAMADKLVFYFAQEDAWVNADDPKLVAGLCRASKVLSCTEGHKHAFVLSNASSTRMAALTADWVDEHVKQVASHASR